MRPGFRLVTVIGGTGFIGKVVVDRLLAQGEEVRIVGRSGRWQGKEGRGVSYLQGDVADASRMKACLKESSVVFHLATGGGPTWTDYERDFVQGTRNIATACMHGRVQRLIYTSSIAALYLGSKRMVNDHTALDNRPQRRSYYSRAKIGAEQVLRELQQSHGLPVVIFRPGVVMGKDGRLNHTGLGTWPSDLCCLGWDRGTHPLPFVLVEDVAQALVAAMDAPGIEGRCFNLVGDVRLSAEEFVQRVAERSRRNFRFYPQSPRKVYAVEMLKWVLKAMARKPENLGPSLRDLRSRALLAPFDCSGAKRVLGWKPTDRLEVFLAEAMDHHSKAILPGDLRLGAATK